MSSTLSRLFHYAKATEAVAVENFTTEAVAAAIRLEPLPFLRALETVGVDCSSEGLKVHTQVGINSGVIDLMLAPSGARPVAIEVKVDSSASGNQLDRYMEWIDSIPEPRRPRLVVLSPRRLDAPDEVVWLPWQSLWQGIGSVATGFLWRDIAVWLEERGMADSSFDPIDEVEAASLEGAHRLLKKAARILTPVAAHLNAVWAGSRWPVGQRAVTGQITTRFRRWPTFTVEHQTRYRAGLSVGVYFEDGAGWLGVWVWAPSKRHVERGCIEDMVPKLPADAWFLDRSHVELLGAYRRLADFCSSEAASEWATSRVDELAACGFFTLIEGFGQGTEEDDAEEG